MRPYCDDMPNTHLSSSLEIPLPRESGKASSRPILKTATKIQRVATKMVLKDLSIYKGLERDL